METSWYCKGEVGEFILDLTESFIDNFVTVEEVKARLLHLDINDSDAEDIVQNIINEATL